MEKLRREKEVVGIYISGHPLDDYKTEIKTFTNANLSVFHDLFPLVNKEITVAGIISDAQHRVAKNGNGWGLFTLEDYYDSYEFRIFGEEYLKFQHFLKPNSFVHLKAFVKEGWVNKEGKKGEPRLQYNSFMLLQEVLEKFSKKLTLKLNLNELQKETIDDLLEVVKTHKGDKPFHITLYELEEEIKLNMTSRKRKVSIESELIQELEDKGFHYQIN
jgi:DNA polymerase-3 subunit alpha